MAHQHRFRFERDTEIVFVNVAATSVCWNRRHRETGRIPIIGKVYWNHRHRETGRIPVTGKMLALFEESIALEIGSTEVCKKIINGMDAHNVRAIRILRDKA
ncbi:hypothetical protein CFP56_043946 [Quercus suber]|uniref:Uncharacterized protein n=1 Tax=Quercus suber TaxID=58331 RepID=A0AAW0IQR3_QUESU